MGKPSRKKSSITDADRKVMAECKPSYFYNNCHDASKLKTKKADLERIHHDRFCSEEINNSLRLWTSAISLILNGNEISANSLLSYAHRSSCAHGHVTKKRAGAFAKRYRTLEKRREQDSAQPLAVDSAAILGMIREKVEGAAPVQAAEGSQEPSFSSLTGVDRPARAQPPSAALLNDDATSCGSWEALEPDAEAPEAEGERESECDDWEVVAGGL